MYQRTKSSSVFSPVNSLHGDFQEFSSHIREKPAHMSFCGQWSKKLCISASNFSQSIFQLKRNPRQFKTRLFPIRWKKRSLNNNILDILHGGRSPPTKKTNSGKTWMCFFSGSDVCSLLKLFFYSAGRNFPRICLRKKTSSLKSYTKLSAN